MGGSGGLARGLAYQLVEQFGVLDRRAADARIRLLSRNERRTLKALGVRLAPSAFTCRGFFEPQAQVLGFAYAELASSSWRPDPKTFNPLPRPAPRPQALALRGLRAVGQLAAPIAELERLDALARAAWPKVRAPSTPPMRCLRSWDGGATTPITFSARLGLRACVRAKAPSGLCFAGGRRPNNRRSKRVPPRPRSPRLRRLPNRLSVGHAAANADEAQLSDAPPREGGRLPHRCLALARPLFQDEKLGRAHRRGWWRAPPARPIAHIARQAESPRPPRRRTDLCARVEMGRGQG